MVRKKILFSMLLLVPVLIIISFQHISAQEHFTLKVVGKSPTELGLNFVTSDTWQVSSGLPVSPKGKKVYLLADTAGTGITFTWALTQKPTGSTATLDSTGTRGNSFTADSTGNYTVTVTVGSKTLTQNIFVSTFRGQGLTQNCAPCHQTPRTADKFPQWRNSGHATMYKRGITGRLAVENGNGIYGTYCVKCHTTNWEPNLNNGNFGYRSKVTGWDTAWYKPATLVNNIIQIPEGDSSRWVRLTTEFPTVEPVATIGCEQCHGPANDHASTGNPTLVATSLEGSTCNTCHDAMPDYTVGSQWAKSNHATMELSAEEAGRTACYPCHSGAAIVKFAKNKTSPGYSAAEDNFPSIACASCHDPHNSTNPSSVRLLTLDSLANGYKPSSNTQFKGGTGVMCMNCHRARENSFVRVTNQAKRFADRFYPHYSPQSDMFLGANAYEYDLNITGQGTHTFMDNACVTCHMAPNPDTTANPHAEADHFMEMVDEEGNDKVYVCQPCHSTVTSSFNEVMAKSDYDGDGSIEGSRIEIQGLLDSLKAILPKDTSGEVVTMARDSLVVKNHPGYPRILPAMYDYHFVKNDWSEGVHNTTYAVAILRRSLAQVTGVEQVNNIIPKTFSLEQNYPNPFNPATTISFSIPEQAKVTLTIYDAVGKQITTLFSGNLSAGNYKVAWNAGNVASGIYYYMLSSDKFSSTKKMVLLK